MSANIVADLVKPLTNLVDDLFTSDEERSDADRKLLQVKLNHSIASMTSQMNVIMAEAQGEGWLQRNWRPLTMITFLVLVCSYWFGFAPEYLLQNPDVVLEVFGLLKIGIGGYIAGRSGEKIAKVVAPIFHAKAKSAFSELVGK